MCIITSYNYRMMIVNVLICLIILTSQSVHSKVITVNSNNGNDSTECCVKGECACSSLFTALLNISNNTIINITSESVALNNTTTMGSGKLTNITITGSNVTIVCNNSGSVYCELCDDVRIEGITWDRCGDPNGTNIAGVTFDSTSNISLINCTFQHSQLPAVSLLEVSDNILIQGCSFLSNIPVLVDDNYDGILSISRFLREFSSNSNVTITVNNSHFYNNGYLQNFTVNPGYCPPLSIDITDNLVLNCDVIFKKTKFISNRNAVDLKVLILKMISIELTEILVLNNSFLFGYNGVIDIVLSSSSSDVVLSIMSSNFTANEGGNVLCDMTGNKISTIINESSFTDSKLNANSRLATVGIFNGAYHTSEITFYRVQISNNTIGIPYESVLNGAAGAVSIISNSGDVKINMYMVNFTSNKYLGHPGGALYIFIDDGRNIIIVQECKFISNKSPGHGAALFIYTEDNQHSGSNNIQIMNTHFDQNIAGSSIVYITHNFFTTQGSYLRLQVSSSTFTNNVASSLYLPECNVQFSGVLLFENNTAENGGAIYLDQGTTVTIENEATVQFIDNLATLNGGAIYVNFLCNNLIGDANIFSCTDMFSKCNVMFINNSARVVGNSLYFNVPRFCPLNSNISDSGSILYVPCQFNYIQPVNGKMMNIPCDLDYTLLNGTKAPIVTSPHELRLYFPFNDGYNISSPSNHNLYFIANNVLGYPVKFTSALFDYFGKLAEPTLFNIQLQCLQITECSTYILIGSNHDNILTQSIDNFTIPYVNFKGKSINVDKSINLTITLTSFSYSIDDINATVIVELVPCIDHPGYTYNEDLQVCVCYHTNVKCNTDGGNEIKRGYWFGSIGSKATTSLCPNHYCQFTNRKQTGEGYFELPNTVNAQCDHHRVGRACGECSSGYTLSYDSTDCISVDQCGSGWTVLVITLTCLYWIVIVAAVFSLMYLNFQISSGYLYGLIYYYSMISILLNNNPYVSDDAFQFVSVLSSFAQLSPQFLGKLCFVKGLNGIDQLFIHYSHAVAVSLLLLLIVVAARFSTRITLFVSCCIIRVICLLILLSYTSIASTSLLLLLPLRFTDVKEWYTYSSPRIQYFHGRHAVYGVVAIICELVVVIGLPLLFLLEPVLSRKINFIRIKPLLDQFQGCYKDKYRWFAAYYLICRQVIFLIVYIFNSNYYNMLFHLQTACVIIALIHMWFQPYHNELLNALDGVMLLVMVLIVNINTFSFLHNVTTELSLILVILPLLLFCTIAVKKVVHSCFKKKYRIGSAMGSHA